jgi:DNA repair protein RecN (Recombination protein N)
MIRHLVLNNLVLVESCEIHFSPTFNVVTGETGAGKTALIEAIGLCLGNRADASLLRKGCDKAFVEAAFDVDGLVGVKEILEEGGLSIESGELLTIRREIAKEGKNRAFINCRTVPLPLLQKIGSELIDLIGQGAHQSLLSSEAQRQLVDLYGGHEKTLKTFQTAFYKERELCKKLEELKQLSLRRERDEEIWRSQLEEIETVNLKKDEEEALFEKYQRLAHAQEICEKVDLAVKGLSETAIPQLLRYSKACDSLIGYDRKMEEPSKLIHEAQISLSEALRSLQSYSQNIDNDPKTFDFLENRLSAITRLKRKFGQTFEEIDAYALKLKTELSRLENLSEELESTEKLLTEAKETTNQCAQELSEQRKQTALQLQKTLTSQLQSLNMAGAEVTIGILPQPRSQSGDDIIQFWLKANTGEHPGLVKEHSSGGELSRLLFAMKTTLAEKNNTPTLIFDEVDSNVGGKTASIMGEKLQELGKHRQVICITHFPQVASKGDTHFSVQKFEEEGRTKTKISILSKKEREKEMLRMLGADTVVSVRNN